ncbi:MAG TPA: DUF3084 domain-containing protein [Candidatus Baltobacteraceae bacterium]|jgi:hypothetical protein
MSVADFFRGVGLVLFIVALAGAIAYVGDRVGHQVGRKRLTLFNIRPRYTSTIIAVGTGMIIALVVTLAAIFANQEVKLAFFHLNAINQQIQSLQARAHELENKVNNSRVVATTDTLMWPAIARIPQNTTPAKRTQIVQQYYKDTVHAVDQTWTKFGLKPYKPPSDIDRKLEELANGAKTQAALAQSDVLLLTTAGQNLYEKDRIQFEINGVLDKLVYRAGEPIAQLTIAANKNFNINAAYQQLFLDVQREANRRGLPQYFETITSVRSLQVPARMQRTVSQGSGTYVLTAFAGADIYPSTGISIVVTLAKSP